VAESQDAATATERAFASAFGGAEDALVGFATTGRLELKNLADSILADITRMAVRQTITAPLAGLLQSGFANGGLFGLFHEGGTVGEHPPAIRYADSAIFGHAPRAPFVPARARSRPRWRARSIGRAGTDERPRIRVRGRLSVPRRHGDAQGVAR
jgi:hypothetical protein